MANTQQTVIVDNRALLVPQMDVAIPPTGATTMPLNGERLDNVAYVMYGSHLEYPRVMKRNNIGYMFDTPPHKRILVE